MALDYVIDLLQTVGVAADSLRQMTESQACQRAAPQKWSPKEIIGHLIDSASNNHKRFVCAQFQNNLCFDGYEQDEWVRRQAYQHEDWLQLITLWQTFNCHLAHVMNSIPDSIRLRPHSDHNLHVRAWEIVPQDEPANLDYFMRDYVGHLKHHLRQIDPVLADTPKPQRRNGKFKSS